MNDTLTAAQKIEQLWGRLDALHQQNADLQLRLQLTTDELQRSQAELAQARARVRCIEGSLLEACREVNAARAAAALGRLATGGLTTGGLATGAIPRPAAP